MPTEKEYAYPSLHTFGIALKLSVIRLSALLLSQTCNMWLSQRKKEDSSMEILNCRWLYGVETSWSIGSSKNGCLAVPYISQSLAIVSGACTLGKKLM